MATVQMRMRRWQIPLTVTLLLAAVLLTYGSALQNGFIGNDDAMLVTENPLVVGGGWKSIVAMFRSYDPELYIPLTLLTFKVEYLLLGANPLPFHLTNILLHALNATLVFFLIRRWQPRREGVAILTALLFAVHPINAEAVSWIAGRKDLLSATFFLAALLSYEKRQRTTWTLFLYLLSLLAKGNAVTFPFVLLLNEHWKGRILRAKLLQRVAPFFLLSALFLIIGFFGKTERIAEIPATLLLPLFAGKGILLQLKHVFLPTDLSPTYPETLVDATALRTWIPLLIVIFAGTILFMRRRRWPDLFHSSFFFLITLAPSFFVFTKGVPYYSITSDRYAYLPLIGILFMLCLGLSRLITRSVGQARLITRSVGQARLITRLVGKARLWEGKQTAMQAMLGGAVIVIFGFMSAAQANHWKEDKTVLWMMIRSSPDFGMSYLHLGDFLGEDGLTDEAIAQYEEGIRREQSPVILGLLLNSLGKAYRNEGRIGEAREAFEKSLLLLPKFGEPRKQLEEMEDF